MFDMLIFSSVNKQLAEWNDPEKPTPHCHETWDRTIIRFVLMF
jgi:hypothetical protein